MNKSNGNMYDWITHTWNPLGGECPHHCTYCSTQKLAKRYPVIASKYSGPVTPIRKTLDENLGKGNFIFVEGQGDLFAEEVPYEYIRLVLKQCDKYDNSYLFQSKNPGRIYNLIEYLPRKSVVCTTIETNRWYPDVMKYSPMPIDRVKGMMQFNATLIRTYITIEPIMAFDLEMMIDMIYCCRPDQVNIGADSGHNHLPEPSKQQVDKLIGALSKFTTIAKKTNLDRLLR